MCASLIEKTFFKANIQVTYFLQRHLWFYFLTIKSWIHLHLFESDLDFSPNVSQLFTQHHSIIIRKVSWALSSHFAERLTWKKLPSVIFKITLYGSPFCIPILHTGKCLWISNYTCPRSLSEPGVDQDLRSISPGPKLPL